MYYGSAIYLIYYFSRGFITKALQMNLSKEQVFSQKYVAERISRQKAAYLWEEINEHKWNISEKIGRDVGFNVAAVDYLENINQTLSNPAKPINFQNSRWESSFS